jgi:cell division protein FtsW (lipid II flippase)
MPIIRAWIALTIYGILAVYSVSIHEAFTTTLKIGDPSNYFYFFKQVKNILFALISAGFIYAIPMRIFQKEKSVTIIAILLMILQLAVFLPWIGAVYNGARGWIDIPLLPSIQPAEFFKLGYVLFLWWWLIRKRDKVNTKEFFISFLVLNAFFFLIFLFIPDLGTIMILAIVGLVMCRYAGAKIKYILWILFWWLILW